MTISARFSSICPDCGQRIHVGSQVLWARGEKARHVDCSAAQAKKAATSNRPAAPRTRAPRNTEPALKPGEQIVQRGGHDPAPYTVGETLHMARVPGGGGPDGRFWTITWAGASRRGWEDNQEFERRYVSGHARPATDEEAAPVAARIAAREAKAAEAKALAAVLQLSGDWFSRVFRQAVRRAGVQDFRWHDLRHTFASRLAMRGVQLQTLQRLLGHRSIQQTMRYSHLCEQRLHDAVDRL